MISNHLTLPLETYPLLSLPISLLFVYYLTIPYLFTIFIPFLFLFYLLLYFYLILLFILIVNTLFFIINELDQNRTDIYFRDKEILYLIKLLILTIDIYNFLGNKRFELLKVTTIEFTAQPFLPIKEVSLT